MGTETDFGADPEFQKNWAILGTYAFSQQRKAGPTYRTIYGLLKDERYREQWPLLQITHNWLLVPYSFWVTDMIGLGNFMVGEICAGRPFPRRFTMLMRFLNWFPAKLAQELIALHEHEVQVGKYDKWVPSNKRYLAYEKKVQSCPLIQKKWAEIKAEFPVEEFRNPAGIVRRHIASERNFKNEDFKFQFGQGDVEDEFYRVFTAFCAEHNLWGMEYDKPLLLKLSVNLTPFCILIAIPFYMNIGRGDILWKEISKVLKAVGAAQASLSRIHARQDREEEALRVYEADKSARALGLEGQKRIDYIIKEACLLPNTDARIIRLRLALAKKLLAQRGE